MIRVRLACLLLATCVGFGSATAKEAFTVLSPNRRLLVELTLDDAGRLTFEARRDGAPAVGGALGLAFAESGPLQQGLKTIGHRHASRDETYAVPVGKTSQARDRHHEAIVSFEEEAAPHRRFDVALRAYDDGVALRYLLPEQVAMEEFVLTDELTRFEFPGDPLARSLPLAGYTTSYEAYYQSTPVSAIGADQLLALPLLVESSRGDGASVWVAVNEANLTDYAGLYLSGDEAGDALVAKLSPRLDRADAAKVVGRTPHASPWRVLMIADDLGRLIESDLVFHLNEPSRIDDPSWIRPGKTTFPWWNAYVLEGVDFAPGVNTATMKHYIDFCAAEGIPYHSLDGLDVAWYGGPIAPEGPVDVTTANDEIDLPELLQYAKDRGVRLRLWMHWQALKPQIDEAFRTYEQWGIEGVMVDFMDRDDQEMVNFYREMAEKAARHRLTVTLHGAYKPTGMERTWPNVLSYEGVLNQEYNKWSERGTPPKHNLDAAFIRMLAGPLDYHQGGMRTVLPAEFLPRDAAPIVQGTRGHQLAMYVVYQNHLSMLADYPSAYRDQAGWDFLVDVPCTWDETRVLHAEIDECVVIARRRGDSWRLGGMTADAPRTLVLPLGFLGEGEFDLILDEDDPERGPTALVRSERRVRSGDTLHAAMPAAGGFVATLRPASR